MRIFLKYIVGLLGVIAGLLALAALWFWMQILGGKPVLTGEQSLAGLSQPVTIERDALGVPTILSGSRLDAARALGFLHAQDRFFQMDLGRRSAAGELSELFGRATLPLDRAARLHEFRARAAEVLERLPVEQRLLAQAYTDGVNAGLAALRTKPFEYVLLRVKPEPWKAEDIILVIYSMALELQGGIDAHEYALGALRDRYGDKVTAFLVPDGSDLDAPIDGGKFAPAPMPARDELNRFNRDMAAKVFQLGFSIEPDARETVFGAIGSNSFALSGVHTFAGAPLLAGDMHLGLRVPNTWYRVQFGGNGRGKDNPMHRIIGITLPGVPMIVEGSNGRIAWTFTNAVADTADLVIVEPNASEPNQYQASPNQYAFYVTHRQLIQVKGGRPDELVTRWSQWGPIIGQYDERRLLALHWTMHDPTAIDLNFDRMAEMDTVAGALALAPVCGVPTLNMIVIDRQGSMGWTVCGRLPRRVGWDGRIPVQWAKGGYSWDGYLAANEYPRLINPPSGCLWTANSRVVTGEALSRLGDGGYDIGARATQLRDDLAKLERAKAADMLAIQLDDRADLLERWQRLLLQTLTPVALEEDAKRADFRRLVENWGGHASVDSVGYYLVRSWRERLRQLAFAPVLNACQEAYPKLKVGTLKLETPLWRMVQEKPAHLLSSRFHSWEDLMLQAVDDVITINSSPTFRTWGEVNRSRIEHPLARVLPKFAARWLNMPEEELPGDVDMPRVQGPAYGASQRMVVSPGHEEEGIFQMPCGQSGYPLSPFYRDGHDAWVRGAPQPLLAGPAIYTFRLVAEK